MIYAINPLHSRYGDWGAEFLLITNIQQVFYYAIYPVLYFAWDVEDILDGDIFYEGYPWICEDILYSLIVMEHTFNFHVSGQMDYIYYGYLEDALYYLYLGLLQFYNPEHGALSATIGGPPDDALTAMAMGFLAKSDYEIFDEWLISNMTEYLWSRRTGNNSVNSVYYNPSNTNSLPA